MATSTATRTRECLDTLKHAYPALSVLQEGVRICVQRTFAIVRINASGTAMVSILDRSHGAH